MNSQNKLIILIAAVIVIFGGLTAYALTMHDSDDSSADDIAGHWYQIGYWGYTDGEYFSSDTAADDSLLLNWGLTVQSYNSDTGSFSAYYNNALIYGVYRDGQIAFYSQADNVVSMFSGYVDGNMMCIATTEKGAGSQAAYYLVFSTDRNASCHNLAPADLSGTWKAADAEMLIDGMLESLVGTAFTVEAQQGAVFHGLMEQEVNDTVTELAYTAVLSDRQSNGFQLGYLLCNGENWDILLRGDQLILRTTMVSDTGILIGEQAAVERIYTRDSAVVAAPEAEMQLKGTVWSYDDLTWPVSDTHYYYDINLKITAQFGSLLSGTMSVNSETLPMTAYLSGTDPVCIGFSAANGDGSTFATGHFAGDRLIFDQWYVSNHGYSSVASGVLRNGAADVTDPTGYWYYSSRHCMDSTGNSYDSDVLYGLDIYACQNGTVYGTYGTSHFSGTYGLDNLQFCTELSDGTLVNFFGNFVNEHVLVGYIVEYSTTQKAAVSYVVYRNIDLFASYPYQDSKLAGSWTSPDGSSFQYYDGQSHTLLGNSLTLSQQGRSRFFQGTMEQEVAGQLVTKQVIGLNLTISTMEYEHAILIDDTGILYSASLIEGVLELHFVDFSDSGNRMAAGARLYTADGSTPAVPTYYDLTDKTWTASDIYTVQKDGTAGRFGQMTLTVTSQYQNAFAGTVTIDGTAYSMIGSLGVTDTVIQAQISFNSNTNIISVETCFIDPTAGTFTIIGDMDGDGNAVAYTAVLKEQ